MNISLVFFDGCPNWKQTDADLESLATEFDFTVTHQIVATIEDAERRQFRGSPTVLIDGTDPFAGAEDPIGLACRMYQTPTGKAGAPTIDMLRRVIGQSDNG
ncbi:MAG: thioredoxin family protein [Acidimicrobiia bacterium]|nr:thioredoxin family protein [Acidimicrobiia bacterium]MDH5503624.1 thioredoxin family protein [Acidimicrobiia bacterium]